MSSSLNFDCGSAPLHAGAGSDCPTIVMADSAADSVMLSERVGVTDLDSEHFRAQLLERLWWAVGEAHVAEQADRGE